MRPDDPGEAPARAPRLGRWVVGAAAAAFAAGLAVGLALPRVADAVATPPRADADERYVRDLGDRYDLSAAQTELIRMVLEAREGERMRLLLGDTGRLPEQIQIELGSVDLRANERIKYVLTDEQRERFLHDEAAPLTGSARRPDATPGEVAAPGQDR